LKPYHTRDKKTSTEQTTGTIHIHSKKLGKTPTWGHPSPYVRLGSPFRKLTLLLATPRDVTNTGAEATLYVQCWFWVGKNKATKLFLFEDQSSPNCWTSERLRLIIAYRLLLVDCLIRSRDIRDRSVELSQFARIVDFELVGMKQQTFLIVDQSLPNFFIQCEAGCSRYLNPFQRYLRSNSKSVQNRNKLCTFL